MEESGFENTGSSAQFGGITPISSKGATSRCQIVRRHGKRMFMKHIRPELKDNRKYKDAFVKEFEIGFNLDHPNIVRYYEIHEDNAGIYMLTEYVDGITLTEMCDTDPAYFQKQENVYKLLNQLLDTLNYIHANQILHLDLKPDNILLTKVGHDLKLIDFGFSYSDEFDTTMGFTNSYASPEQQKRLKKYDCRTDLYALGQIVRYICEHGAAKKSSSLMGFADRCTKENPDDRFQNAIEARDWLNRTKSKRTMAIWTTIVIILLALASVAGFFMRKETESVEPQQPTSKEEKIIIVAEEASEQEVVHAMDSVFKEIYSPMRHLWEKNGVEADCKALTVDERVKLMNEVNEFNDNLRRSWDYELLFLTNKYPKHRVFIYKNYRYHRHPAEADSLKKWIDTAKEMI